MDVFWILAGGALILGVIIEVYRTAYSRGHQEGWTGAVDQFLNEPHRWLPTPDETMIEAIEAELPAPHGNWEEGYDSAITAHRIVAIVRGGVS